MWLCIHAFEESLWLIDSLYYRVDMVTFGCTFNYYAHRDWANMTDVLMFILLLAIKVMSFPVVIVRKARRNHAFRGETRACRTFTLQVSIIRRLQLPTLARDKVVTPSIPSACGVTQ
ncbi:hypothetical protein BV898_15381 [Hypsibius exemplaris]|uniref:Uncharacterized protein n=1 Tax=Hypsibius exemplaris TaxID=2072580 RepID=A0A9X6NCV7_HYPEX|nr:hypothetical protein BV898_15381 [Hypsibius exemplaris]